MLFIHYYNYNNNHNYNNNNNKGEMMNFSSLRRADEQQRAHQMRQNL